MASLHPSVAMEDLWFLQGGGECGALLRQIDWTTHPRGHPAQWPLVIQATTAIILGSRQAMFMSWGPEHSTIYNDNYSELCGKKHPAAMGAPLQTIWYDIWDVLEGLVERTYAGESIYMDDIEFLMQRNGYPEETHFSFSYNPIRTEKSDIIGLFCACAEITKTVTLQRELDHQRIMLAQLFQQSPSFIAKLAEPDHKFEFANPSYMQLIGQRDIIGKSVVTALPEVESQGYIDLLDTVFRTGKALKVDGSRVVLERVKGGPLEERFVDFVYQPVFSAAGKVTGIFVEGNDVTDHVEAMSALRKSEQFLRSVLEASPDWVKVIDLDGRVEYVSDGGPGLVDGPLEHSVMGRKWADLWGEPQKADRERLLALARKGESASFQGYAETPSGTQGFWDVRVAPMLDLAGAPERILAVSRDITYLKRIEEEREHLMQELSHRLKNAFSMVQSVINQTLRKAPSVDAARDILTGRVRALSDAQNILTKSIVDTMDIHEVVQAALRPHGGAEGRFDITGPVLTINGKQGLGLSLALHELATNATKYGALSDGLGQVKIDWQAAKDGEFRFRWEELGGPPVSPPSHSGFGSMLVENIVATYFDGKSKLHYLPTGVVFELKGKILSPGDTDTPDPY